MRTLIAIVGLAVRRRLAMRWLSGFDYLVEASTESTCVAVLIAAALLLLPHSSANAWSVLINGPANGDDRALAITAD